MSAIPLEVEHVDEPAEGVPLNQLPQVVSMLHTSIYTHTAHTNTTHKHTHTYTHTHVHRLIRTHAHTRMHKRTYTRPSHYHKVATHIYS